MRLTLTFLISACLLLYLAAFAVAANTQPSPDDVWTFAKPVLDAVMSGNYVHAAAGALVLVCALLRKYGARHLPWFGTDAGGALLVLLSSFFGAVATSTAAGQLPTWPILWMALKLAVLAAGGFSLVKKLLVDPFIRPMVPKLPTWLQPLFKLILWVFDKPDPIEQAIRDGKAALEKKPSTGTSGVVGGPRDIP